MRLLALSLAAVLLAGAAARADVVLTPSAQPGTCVLEPPTDALRPVASGCLSGDVNGEPVFSPDGRMLYLAGDPPSVMPGWRSSQAAVFARDPTTGALTRLDCSTSSGATRCPPANETLALSADGRSLYALDPATFTLTVYGRAEDGALTEVQCLEVRNPANPYPVCDPVLPRSMTWMRMSPDGASLYLAGNLDGSTDIPIDDPGALVRLARDPATGRLTVTDCLTEGNQPGCRVDHSIIDITGIGAVVDQDVYLILGSGSFRAFRADPQTGAMTAICGTVTDSDPAGCGTGINNGAFTDVAPSPDGRRLYVPAGTALLAYPRDPASGQLGKAGCVALESLAKGHPVCSHQNEETDSVAVSADGRTVVTATADQFTAVAEAVGTYHVAAGGSFSVAGCVGRAYGCAPPVGRPAWVRYPPSGPGPYLVTRDHGKGAIQLLAPAPTLRLRGQLTFRGANRVSLTCPAVRTAACRGTIRISFLTNPRGIDPLQHFAYDVRPGATRSVSLRLSPASRRAVAAVGDDVAVIVRVFDDTGLTTPSGITTCLVKDTSGYRCSPRPTI